MSAEKETELEQRLQEAASLAGEERWAEAFELLREEESDHPEDATLLCMLGVVAGEIDEVSGLAYDYYRRCLAQRPTDPDVLVRLGVGLARYDDPEAESVLRLAALTGPELALTRLHYGAYLAREGLYPEAVGELQAARELDAGDPLISRELAAAHLLAGQVEPGVEALARAVEMDEEDPEARLLYGLALLRTGQGEEAAEELYRVSRELLEDGEVQLLSALASAAQEWWDEGWDALARAEGAVVPPSSSLLREVEDALEAGSAAAAALLREDIAPAMLHERLMRRP